MQGHEFEDARVGCTNVVVPPGYRLMPEAERVATLDELSQKLAELVKRYARLEGREGLDEGQKRQQNLLRKKIAETEDAARLLSKPRVLMEL